MKVIDITIQGVTPLLMHRFTDEEQASATRKTRASVKTGGGMKPYDIAEQFLYKDDGGNIVMPQPNLFKCIINGGKFFKVGNSKMTTQTSSLVPAYAMIPTEFVKLEHEQPWVVDSRTVVNPTTHGRITTHRPRFNDWECTFPVELEDDDISEAFFREIVDAAGRRIGLCDFRPERKGFFGRFVVKHWSVDEA